MRPSFRLSPVDKKELRSIKQFAELRNNIADKNLVMKNTFEPNIH